MFATSLMNAALQEQHSSKVTDQSSIVSSKQQESQVSIEEESVSNLDPDDGGMYKVLSLSLISCNYKIFYI